SRDRVFRQASGLSSFPVIARSGATKQSTLSLRRHGLLRCARNDAEVAGQIGQPMRCDEERGAAPRHCEKLLRRSNPFFLSAGRMDRFVASLLAMTGLEPSAPAHVVAINPYRAPRPTTHTC